MEPVDTLNRWMIGRRVDGTLTIARPPSRLTQDEALVFAAYLVAMVCDEGRWQEVQKAVEEA